MSAVPSLPRGCVKAFRAHLNALPGEPHRHGRFRQKTRLYGDYLYAQDRDKFMVDLRGWLEAKSSEPSP